MQQSLRAVFSIIAELFVRLELSAYLQSFRLSAALHILTFMQSTLSRFLETRSHPPAAQALSLPLC
jgi:hypothetical protein